MLTLEEARADGSPGRIVGTVIRYGEVTRRTVHGAERIAAGAFEPIGDVIANAQHQRDRPLARTGGGGLELRDGPDELTAIIDLPDTREAADVATLIRSNVLRGLSVEMRVTADSWQGDLRTVTAAELSGIGIVDRPAYAMSTAKAEARGEPVKLWLL